MSNSDSFTSPNCGLFIVLHGIYFLKLYFWIGEPIVNPSQLFQRKAQEILPLDTAVHILPAKRVIRFPQSTNLSLVPAEVQRNGKSSPL